MKIETYQYLTMMMLSLILAKLSTGLLMVLWGLAGVIYLGMAAHEVWLKDE